MLGVKVAVGFQEEDPSVQGNRVLVHFQGGGTPTNDASRCHRGTGNSLRVSNASKAAEY
jgi:hypothetical protein